MTGYSGTGLSKKLGIKEGSIVGLLGAPDGFAATLIDLPPDVVLHHTSKPSDIFIVFARWTAEMKAGYATAMALIPADGAIWVAWPKKSSGVETDLTGNTMRDLFLPTGMVDNKVCAIDETWSGLRFVVRKENRGSWSGPDSV
jgi:hypothetical protein